MSEELEAKVEAGSASKRLERRIKRKEQRETREIFENITKNLPPLGSLPPLGVEVAPIGEAELVIPDSDELPMPPPPSPADMALPPLPIPERIGKCEECGANVTIKDITIMVMDCPICSSKIKL